MRHSWRQLWADFTLRLPVRPQESMSRSRYKVNPQVSCAYRARILRRVTHEIARDRSRSLLESCPEHRDCSADFQSRLGIWTLTLRRGCDGYTSGHRDFLTQVLVASWTSP